MTKGDIYLVPLNLSKGGDNSDAVGDTPSYRYPKCGGMHQITTGGADGHWLTNEEFRSRSHCNVCEYLHST